MRVLPLFIPEKTGDLGCHLTPFLPVRPCLSTILCKFAHNKIFPSGVTPSLEGVARGGPPASPSDASTQT